MNAGDRTTYVAWVTYPGDETPRRVECKATDQRDCLRQVLSAAPRDSRASVREADHTATILAALALRMSPFPLVARA